MQDKHSLNLKSDHKEKHHYLALRLEPVLYGQDHINTETTLSI